MSALGWSSPQTIPPTRLPVARRLRRRKAELSRKHRVHSLLNQQSMSRMPTAAEGLRTLKVPQATLHQSPRSAANHRQPRPRVREAEKEKCPPLCREQRSKERHLARGERSDENYPAELSLRRAQPQQLHPSSSGFAGPPGRRLLVL